MIRFDPVSERKLCLKIVERLKKFRPSPINLLLIGLIAYVWFRPPAGITEINRPVSPFTATLLDGSSVSSESLRGKVVLVNFWATWCPYCRHEMPAMQEFYRDYHAQGFEILALSIDDDPAKVRDFMRKEGYQFPAAMNSPSQNTAFGEVSSVPTSFLIDKRGVLRKKISGQVHYARLKELVEPLLKE